MYDIFLGQINVNTLHFVNAVGNSNENNLDKVQRTDATE